MQNSPLLLIEIAIEPKSETGRKSLTAALATLLADDLSCGARIDPVSGQTVLAGASELHLEHVIDRLMREFRIAVAVGAPHVAYRETITRESEIDYIHRKQTDGSGEFARIKLRFEPLPGGSGFVFESNIGGGTIPKEFVSGVEKGLRAAAESGIVAGFPVIDLKTELFDGAYHEVDSSILVFEIAGRAAFEQGAAKAAPKVLEPIMRVEVVTPDVFMGDVVGDLNSRRGIITALRSCDSARVIEAMVPLGNMFGYRNTLRSISRGQAEFTMRFDHYEPVPDFYDDDPPPSVAMRA